MSTVTANSNAAPKRKGPPPIDQRIAPELTTIRPDVVLPPIAARSVKRGIKSVYPFNELEIGQSFGVRNKKLAQINSVVSSQNRKHLVPKMDANGHPITKPVQVTATTADGKVMQTVANKPVMIASKRFVAAEVDAKTDPDKASVRVWRVALPAA